MPLRSDSDHHLKLRFSLLQYFQVVLLVVNRSRDVNSEDNRLFSEMTIKKLLSISLVLISFAALGQNPIANQQTIAIPSGVPLHIRVTRTALLSMGAKVDGVLTQPIFVADRLIVPAGTQVRGVVSDTVPVALKVHVQALLNGDVTPLHDPVVDFSSLHLAQTNTTVLFDSRALIRDSQLVRFLPTAKRPTLKQRLETIVRARVQSVRDSIFAPGKKDRALRLLYSQLPYHPQRIWEGTQFIADLNTPMVVTLEAQSPVPSTETASLNGVKVTARLVDTIDSSTAAKGELVTAIVTQPVFDTSHKMVLLEGAELEGTVMQSRAARSFGRNGELRFTFRGVKRTGEASEKVYGILTGAEGNAGQNLTVDSEGNVQASPDKDRFLAPLLLAVTAAAGRGDDHHHHDDDDNVGGTTVASNGFGLVARVLALTISNQDVATGFGAYAFAKSVYFRFLVRGHEVSFPKDTLVEVQLSDASKKPSSLAPR